MRESRSWWWLGCGVFIFLIMLTGAAYAGQSLLQGHMPGAAAQSSVRLAIDADITNGTRPCDPIDGEATVAVGATHKVGVCIEGYQPNSVNYFELYIRYTGDPGAGTPSTTNVATEVADVDPALDDNPDANDGDDPAGLKLGGGWDCTALGLQFPQGDYQLTPDATDAVILCNADLGSPDQDLTADPGLLATIEYTATTAGVDTIDFGPLDATNKNNVGIPRPGNGIARCGTAVPADQVTCTGATVHKGGEGGPAPTPTSPAGGATPPATPPSGGPTPTATAPPTGPRPTPTPLPPGLEAVDLAVGCNPLASTYSDGTSIETLAAGVGPLGIITSMWKFEIGRWLGYSPAAPDASDLREGDFLDVLFVCVNETGAFVRPVV